MNRDNEIPQISGDAFRVPEGYFDTFADRVMERLPEAAAERKPRPAIMRMLAPVIAAAACVCIAVFGLTMFLSDGDSNSDAVAESSYSAEEAMMDYAMIDNADIYAYLSEY